jgi:hypothetical protein
MPFISSAHRAPLQADLTTDRRLKRIAKQRKEAALALKAERAAIALQEEETALQAEREREHIGKIVIWRERLPLASEAELDRLASHFDETPWRGLPPRWIVPDDYACQEKCLAAREFETLLAELNTRHIGCTPGRFRRTIAEISSNSMGDYHLYCWR